MPLDLWCRSLLDGTELSHCFRTHIVRTLVPSVPIGCIILALFLRRIHSKVPGICKLWRLLKVPFSQFLEFEDLAEYDASLRLEPSAWKQRALSYLSILQTIAWLIFLIYQVETQPRTQDVWFLAVNVLTWAVASFIIYSRSSGTAPYMLIIFFMVNAASAAIDLVSDVIAHNIDTKSSVPGDVVRLILDSSLTCIAGSLPMRIRLPCPNVAGQNDTPSNKLSSPEDGISLWSWLSFSFVEPVLDLAVQRSRNLAVIEPNKSTLDSPQLLSASPTQATYPEEHDIVVSREREPCISNIGSSSKQRSSTAVDDYISDTEEEDLTFGTQRTLDEEDIWSLPPTFLHRNLFTKYLSHKASHPDQSLIGFLLQSNSLDLIIDVSVELWRAFVGFVPSYALQQILALLSSDTPSARSQAYLYSFLTFIAHLSFAQLDLFQGWHTRRCYERTRGQLFCALHWKALRRRDIGGVSLTSGDGDKPGLADLGKVVNLMQGDTYAVAQRFWDFSAVFAAPVRLTIAMVFLYKVLGWSSLAGVLVVVVAWVLNYPLAKWNISITRSSWKAKDKRMSGVHELFQSIRFLKYYGWDGRWAHRVDALREEELSWRVKEAIVDTLISFIWTWIPSATALFAFMSYTLIAKQELTVSKAFVSVALFEQLQAPLTALPGQVFALLHAYVSMQRIESYLAEEEVPVWASSLKAKESPNEVTGRDSESIGFEHATFEWHTRKGATAFSQHPENSDHGPYIFQLSNLSVRFPRGKLSLIAGRTGAGKSALLNALLGEMYCLSGTVHIDKQDHRVAFCAQNPWLEHATIRDNILYGREYDKDRYEKVLEACALEKDFIVLPAGDFTEIGEKGVTLSGGQKSRIALARAIYSRAECLLLDDPLAAVDMHTANHLYEACISGELLQGRTVILVTHHIKLCLPNASYLVELSNGRITYQGTIEELRLAGHLNIIATNRPIQSVEPESSSTTLVSTPINEADLSIEKGKSVVKRNISRPIVPKGKLVAAEARAVGRVNISAYLTYFRAGGWLSWIMTLFLLFSIRGVTIGNQMFLAQWGQAYGNDTSSRAPILDSLPSPATNVQPWLSIFLLICMIGAFLTISYIALGYYTSLCASRTLFKAMLFRLCRAPITFFDVTLMGRILNRFVTDFGTVDGALNNSARAALSGTLTFISSFGVIVILVPPFLPFAIVIAYLYLRLAPAYILASRDLRRLELTSLSPTFSSFDELLHGLAHVRAFAMESRYQDRFYAKVDKFQSFDHVYWLLNVWMRWRYDCLGSLVVFCATIFSLWSGIASGSAAVVIVQAGVFAESSRQLIKVSAQLELDFNSVERIAEYLNVPEEAFPIIPDHRPPAYWPSSSGSLEVENLSVRYRDDLPPVLHNLSFTVMPGEKIGVVGRTGSGKSTLAISLLRIVEPGRGRIILDGIDISTIGLDDLRTRITIISQDVSLFSGTIRSNIDPFEEHSDHECWDVLKRCHLAPRPISDLDFPISQTGSLSSGERQLVALARALLRRSQVVIMDEATSAIDLHLDDMVQKTIREELSEALVLTIAHRLRTVVDYDRIMVLGSEGRILEFDTPARLLGNASSVFAEMCRGSADWEELKNAILERTGTDLVKRFNAVEGRDAK